MSIPTVFYGVAAVTLFSKLLQFYMNSVQFHLLGQLRNAQYPVCIDNSLGCSYNPNTYMEHRNKRRPIDL